MINWFNKKKDLGSLCLFSCYLTENSVPTSLKNYLEDLSNHFSQIILLTHIEQVSPQDLEFLNSIGVQVMHVKNEGYDFGMYFQALTKIDLRGYSQLALVNDSNFLCQKLDPFFNWIKEESDLDMAGILDSFEIKHHLQSYLLVFKNRGIACFLKFLNKNGIKKDKNDVIRTYEIGLTDHFSKQGLNLDSFFKTKNYTFEASKNPSFFLLKDLLKDKFPLIKKKILLDSFNEEDRRFLKDNGFEFDSKIYLKLIRTNNPEFNHLNQFLL